MQITLALTTLLGAIPVIAQTPEPYIGPPPIFEFFPFGWPEGDSCKPVPDTPVITDSMGHGDSTWNCAEFDVSKMTDGTCALLRVNNEWESCRFMFVRTDGDCQTTKQWDLIQMATVVSGETLVMERKSWATHIVWDCSVTGDKSHKLSPVEKMGCF